MRTVRIWQKAVPVGTAILLGFASGVLASCEDRLPPRSGGKNGQAAPKPARSGMIIHFERTGGFAGMLMKATIDSESLSPEEAGKLHELVLAAGFFELPDRMSGVSENKDGFVYRVTVKQEGRRHTVHAAELAAPPSLRALIEWLNLTARKSRMGKGE